MSRDALEGSRDAIDLLLDVEAFMLAHAMQAIRYDAFISYSHAADSHLVASVQYALQRLAKPWYRLRSMRIFRDQTSLAASPGLWSAIEAALSTSRYFLYIATPQAAQSPWVAREVQWWLTNRSADHLLIVLTEGEIAWSQADADFDWTISTALAPCLGKAFSGEPLYVDLRWVRSAEQRSIRHVHFHSAMLDLAATLLDRPKDEIDGDDVREHQRTRRVAGLAIACLAVAAATASAAAYVAIRQRDAAIASALVIHSGTLLKTSPELAALLAREAFELHETDASELALRRALAEHPESILRLGKPDVPVNAGFAGTQLVAVSSESDQLAGRKAGVWNVVDGRQIATLPFEIDDLPAPSMSLDGKSLVLATSRDHFAVYDATTWRPLRELSGSRPRFTRDGRHIAAQADDVVRLWDSVTLEQEKEVALPLDEFFDISRDASHVLAVLRGRDWFGTVLSTTTGAPALDLADHAFLEGASFTPSGKELIAWSEQGAGELWDIASGKRLRAIPGEVAGPESGSLHAGTGQLAVGTASGAVHFWSGDLYTHRINPSLHSERTAGVEFSPDGRLLLSSSSDGSAALSDTSSAKALAQFGGPWDFVWAARMAGDDQRFATIHIDGSVRIWLRDTWYPQLALGSRVARLSTDGRFLFTVGGAESDANLRDLGTGDVVATLKEPVAAVLGVAVHRPSNRMVLATVEGVEVWDLSKGARVSLLRDAGDGTRVVALSPDGKLLATAGRAPGARLWDMDTHKLVSKMDGFGSDVADLVFAPSGKSLFGATLRGRVTERDLSTGEQRSVIEAVAERRFTTISLSADASRLLVAGGTSAELWDLASRRLLRTFAGHADSVSAAALSTDGRWVATGGGFRAGGPNPPAARNEVLLWDAETGQELLRYRAATDAIKSLAFTADSHRLVAVDAQARIYRCAVCGSTAELRTLAAARIKRALSDDERRRYGLGVGLLGFMTERRRS